MDYIGGEMAKIQVLLGLYNYFSTMDDSTPKQRSIREKFANRGLVDKNGNPQLFTIVSFSPEYRLETFTPEKYGYNVWYDYYTDSNILEPVEFDPDSMLLKSKQAEQGSGHIRSFGLL